MHYVVGITEREEIATCRFRAAIAGVRRPSAFSSVDVPHGQQTSLRIFAEVSLEIVLGTIVRDDYFDRPRVRLFGKPVQLVVEIGQTIACGNDDGYENHFFTIRRGTVCRLIVGRSSARVGHDCFTLSGGRAYRRF